jgi:hypothetical protein
VRQQNDKKNFFRIIANSLSVFDTWSKINSGYYAGNFADFGLFTDCLNFEHNTKKTFQPVIQGQYCLVKLLATQNTTPIDNNDNNSDFDWREM